ncbi:MAG: hypothetical protein OXE50_08905 [Chloroflexi bacterium]|nr:hypothetical protein [Chloroflexota bacterium]
MNTQIKHLAIQSDIWDKLYGFYSELFHMTSFNPDNQGAVTDGNIGLNFNQRSPGRQAGLDHWGFDVDDLDAVKVRLGESYPSVELLQRPPTRPYATLGSHDTDGNYFDLSTKKQTNRTGVYAEQEVVERRPRHIDHVVLRTMHASELAKFYMDVYELSWAKEPTGGPTYHLTDGTTTFVITQWRINDFEGGGIARPALDHIGFRVESLETFEKDLEALKEERPQFAPKAWRASDEQEARLGLLRKCEYGTFQLWDPQGVLIDVSEAK